MFLFHAPHFFLHDGWASTYASRIQNECRMSSDICFRSAFGSWIGKNPICDFRQGVPHDVCLVGVTTSNASNNNNNNNNSNEGV
jgi:hypothetical protein